MRHDDVMKNEDILLSEGQLLATRFSAMFAQCRQGVGAYDANTGNEQDDRTAQARAIAVADACRTLIEDTADIACDQALARRGLEPDVLDALGKEEEDPEWRGSDYDEIVNNIAMSDRARNRAAFDAFVAFAGPARQYGLAGALPPIEGVDKHSVGTQVLSAEDFSDLANTTDVTGVDPDSLYSIDLLGIEITRDNAFEIMNDFSGAFEPDQRSEILQMVDDYGHTMGVDAKVQSMLFQDETQPVGDVMKETAQVLGYDVDEYA